MDHVSRLACRTALGLLLAASCAVAEDECAGWEYWVAPDQYGGSGTQAPHVYSAQSACAAAAAAYDALQPTRIARVQSVTGGPPPQQMLCHIEYSSNGGGSWDNFNVVITAVAVECPAECELKQDQKFLAVAEGVSDSFVPPGQGCFAGCAAFLRANQPWSRLGAPGDRDWMAQYQYTGQECDEEPVVVGVDTSTGPEKCVEDGGLEVCSSPNLGPGCGYYNDQYACLGNVSDGNRCFEETGGGLICAEGTPTPPVPDNGTAGVPATPTTVINQTTVTNSGNTSTVTHNYYNSTTVSGSSRPAGGEADPGGDDTGDDEEDEASSASGGDACDSPPSCSGDPIQCVQLKQQWLQRCPDAASESQIEALLGPRSPIDGDEHDFTGALSAVTVTAAGGECPAPPEIALPGGGTVQITVMTHFCTLAAMIAPLVMIMAYVSAALIVGGKV